MAQEDLHLSLMIPELESLTASRVSLHCHIVMQSASVQDMLCVTILDSVPKHEEQRFYCLNTQTHPHVRAADGLVWITGTKIFPQPSIHWMFHCFSHMYLESPLLSAGALQLLTNPDESSGTSVLQQLEKWQVFPMRTCEIILKN